MTRTLETLELVGGALCLDFVNTINSRLNPEHDYLVQYSDLVGWASKVGLLFPAQAGRLQTGTKQNPREAEKALHQALLLRELLYRLFLNAVRDSEQSKKDMGDFLLQYGEAIKYGLLLEADGHYTINWKLDQSFDSLLSPILHSAAELLLYGALDHVKECPGCGWLFLDTSKNQSRRWCSMNTCGARDKMRRYHKRQRSK